MKLLTIALATASALKLDASQPVLKLRGGCMPPMDSFGAK